MKGAIIGAGYFAQFHYEAWTRLSGITITAIADLDPDKARSLAGTDSISTYRNYQDMIEKEQPDFIDIITPPDSHLSLLEKIIPYNIPIIIQKPLAPDFTTCQTIHQLISNSNTRVMVHENWRFQPWYRYARKCITEGRIGTRIHQLSFHMRMGDGWKDSAYMDRQPYFRDMSRLLIHETGIHFIDTFRYLLGEVDTVYARLAKYNTHIAGEDAGILVMNHINGSTSIWNANRYNESNKENPRFTFGHMLLEGNLGSLRLYEDGSVTLQQLGQPEKMTEFSPSNHGFAGDCVYATQAHFIECLQSGNTFETNIHEYMKSILVQEAVYQSDRDNQVISIKDLII